MRTSTKHKKHISSLAKKPSPPAHVLLKTFSHIFITFRENKEYKKYNISNRAIIIILFLSLCQP